MGYPPVSPAHARSFKERNSPVLDRVRLETEDSYILVCVSSHGDSRFLARSIAFKMDRDAVDFESRTKY